MVKEFGVPKFMLIFFVVFIVMAATVYSVLLINS